MKIYKTLLSLLITCGVISSGVMMSASAADSNIYNDITNSSESKEDEELIVPDQVVKVGNNALTENADQDENVSASA